ncbi:MAG: ABC transporter permease [Nocardioidaceae bacterium]|nr:ABC transporter permease [Nocardioidaceae bacterium]NUS50747.1 ABC transporter permease [Nocardioidaceae bacterium]
MTTAALEPTTLDISGTPRIPLSRLVLVELRKLADTRAGKWLLITIGVITALIIGVFFLTAKTSDRTFLNFVGVTATPQGFLLPVLGILLVTQEWTQRTALVSFTLVPVRSRVMVAKVLAALVAGLAAIALALGIAAVATLLGGADNAWAQIGADDIGKFALLQASGVLQGLAFGLLFLNSAAAIVTYFVLPTAFSIVAGLWKPLEEAAPWVDLGTSQQPLFSGTDLSTDQWLHLATGTLIWVVLPFALGLLRVLRAEVK